MDIDEIMLECEEKMDKAVEYLRGELRGIRTGRASPALVEYVKVEYYGSQTDLRQLAQVSVPEPTQLLIKPHDPSCVNEIIKAIQAAGLGLNPAAEGKAVRVSIPPLSTERRRDLVNSVHKMGEHQKVAVRNARRDANKLIDQTVKDKDQHLSEDEGKSAKDEVQELTKKHEQAIDEMIKAKEAEVMEG